MSNVVQIGEFRLTRLHKHRFEGCQHKSMTFDAHGEVVTCDECGKQISAWYALQAMIDHYHFEYGKLESRARRLKEAETKALHLKVTRNLESIWRGSTVPCCPHCGEGILLADNLGSNRMSKSIAIKRREATANREG